MNRLTIWKRTAIACCATMLTSGSLRAQTESPATLWIHPPLEADTSTETKGVVERLLVPQKDYVVKSVTLRDVTAQLAAVLKINVVVQWTDLQTAGVTQAAPITLRIHGASYHQILRLVLEQAAAGKLDYIISEGILEIHTRDWLERQAMARVYDLTAVTKDGFYNDPPATPADRAAGLADIVPVVIAPEVWNGSAKPAGEGEHTGIKNACKLVAGQLAVIAPLRVQQETRLLMESLGRPIKLPTSKTQVASNIRAGFPVDLPARLKPVTTVQIDGPVTLPAADVTIAVYDLRDLARRAVYLSTATKPTTHEVIAKLLVTVAEQTGTAVPATQVEQPAATQAVAGLVLREFEGMLIVRGTPEMQRKVATILSTLAR